MRSSHQGTLGLGVLNSGACLPSPPGQKCPYETHARALQAAFDLPSAFLSLLFCKSLARIILEVPKALLAYAYMTLIISDCRYVAFEPYHPRSALHPGRLQGCALAVTARAVARFRTQRNPAILPNNPCYVVMRHVKVQLPRM